MANTAGTENMDEIEDVLDTNRSSRVHLYAPFGSTLSFHQQAADRLVSDSHAHVTAGAGEIEPALARIQAEFPQENQPPDKCGTRFLCRHQRKLWLVTAAHNVLQPLQPGAADCSHVIAERVTATFGGGQTVTLTFPGYKFDINCSYTRPCMRYDVVKYDVTHLAARLPGCWFSVQQTAGEPRAVRMSGYDQSNQNHVQLKTSALRCYEYPYHLGYQQDTFPGQSGAPLYYKHRDSFVVVGMHVGFSDTYEVNTAIKISEIFFKNARYRPAVARPPWQVSCVQIMDVDALPDGRLVLCDWLQRRVICRTRDGQLSWQRQLEGFKQVLRTKYIPAEERLLLIVAGELWYMTLEGALQEHVAPHITRASGLAVAGQRIFVCSKTDHYVHVIDTAGSDLGGFDVTDQFTHMVWLAGDRHEMLVLGCGYTHRLRAYSYSRTGGARRRWAYDGRAAPRLDTPLGMCAAPDGASILVADSGGARVVMISRGGRYVQDVATRAHGVAGPVALTVTKRQELVACEQYGKVNFVRLARDK